MDSFNKVFLMGNLGRDPEIQTDRQGRAFTKLSLAVNRTWKDASGEKTQKTDWHKIYVFGRSGQLCSQFLKKGAPLFVEGHMSIIETGENTEKRSKQMFITADTVKFLPIPAKRSQHAEASTETSPLGETDSDGFLDS